MSETRPAREVRRNAPAPRKGRPQEIEAAQVEYYSDVVEVAGGVSSGSQRCLHLHACAGRPRGSWVLDAHYLPSILNVCCHVRVTVPPLDAGHFSLPSRRLGMARFLRCRSRTARLSTQGQTRLLEARRSYPRQSQAARLRSGRRPLGRDRARGEYRSTSTTSSTRSFGADVGPGYGRRRSRPRPRSSRPTTGSSSRACPRLAGPTAGATVATAATSPRVSGTFRRARSGCCARWRTTTPTSASTLTGTGPITCRATTGKRGEQ
jgi:hypothetical protein